MSKPIEDSQKFANKVGKSLQKNLGENKEFILMVRDNDNNQVYSLTNMKDKINILGVIEYVKNDFMSK